MKSKKAITSYIRDYKKKAICVVYHAPTQEELNTIEDDLCFPLAIRNVIDNIQKNYSIYYISIVQCIQSQLDRYILLAAGDDGFIGLVLHNNSKNPEGYGNFNSDATYKTFDKKLLADYMVRPINRDLDGDNMYSYIGVLIDEAEKHHQKMKILHEATLLDKRLFSRPAKNNIKL